MKFSYPVLSLLLLILAPGALLASEKTPMKLNWDQLAPVLEGREVEIRLQTGEQITGEVCRVLPGSLGLKKKQTITQVPRTSIMTLKVIKETKKWRWIGAVVGYSAVAAPVSASSKFGGEALQGAPTLAVFASAILGYHLGRSKDRRRTTIEILPD